MSKNEARLPRLKVIIIGVENSGKTTLVRNLSPDAKSVEHSDGQGNSITVGLDIGVIPLAGCSLHFFGTPGHERFAFVRKIVSHGAHIGILMIDSVDVTQGGVGEREREYEQELISRNIPYIICANKRDIPNVLPLSEIESHFSASVYPISAVTGQGVDEMRDVLVDIIESGKGEWFSNSAKKLKMA